LKYVYHPEKFIMFPAGYKEMTDTDDSIKKMKNAEQDVKSKAETTEAHAEGKPSSETLNKAKNKVKDALT
jgi:hypothetical protein